MPAVATAAGPLWTPLPEAPARLWPTVRDPRVRVLLACADEILDLASGVPSEDAIDVVLTAAFR